MRERSITPPTMTRVPNKEEDADWDTLRILAWVRESRTALAVDMAGPNDDTVKLW